MLKSVEQLCEIERTSVGNHRVEVSNHPEGFTINKYSYHGTVICTVNENTKVFMTTDGGWKTSSTKRAISSYRDWHNDHQYFEVFNNFSDMVDHIVEMTSHCEHGGKQYRCYYGDVLLHIQKFEITVVTRMIGNKKFCSVTVSESEPSEQEYPIHTYESTYKGDKTMLNNLIEKVSHHFC